MARLTTRIRNNISKDPLNKIKQEQILPEWFSGAGLWIAGALLVLGTLFIGYKAFMSDSGPVTPPANQAETAPQQQVNPYDADDEEDASSSTSTQSPSTTTDSDSSQESSSNQIEGDFTSEETVSIEVETSSLNSRVPEGAMNVALAGVQAMALGDWGGVPVDGKPKESRYLGAEIDFESTRLAEPTPTGADENTQYTFLFDGTNKSGDTVQISVTVQQGDSSYEVVAY